jgi:hypothetical protein
VPQQSHRGVLLELLLEEFLQWHPGRAADAAGSRRNGASAAAKGLKACQPRKAAGQVGRAKESAAGALVARLFKLWLA